MQLIYILNNILGLFLVKLKNVFKMLVIWNLFIIYRFLKLFNFLIKFFCESVYFILWYIFMWIIRNWISAQMNQLQAIFSGQSNCQRTELTLIWFWAFFSWSEILLRWGYPSYFQAIKLTSNYRLTEPANHQNKNMRFKPTKSEEFSMWYGGEKGRIGKQREKKNQYLCLKAERRMVRLQGAKCGFKNFQG